jgi:xanthine/uracil/vitamin C permease (AzgA family)
MLAGLRAVIIRLFPKSVLMAGAAGIGVFIAFVGMKVCRQSPAVEFITNE